MANRPLGVTIVVIPTIIFGVVLLSLSSLFFWLMGPFSLILLLVSLFAFAVSYGMLIGSRYAWYTSLIFWTFFAFFFIWLYSALGWWQWFIDYDGGSWYRFPSIARLLLLPLPFIYSLGCSIYFQTKPPREYFHVSMKETGFQLFGYVSTLFGVIFLASGMFTFTYHKTQGGIPMIVYPYTQYSLALFIAGTISLIISFALFWRPNPKKFHNATVDD